MALDPLTAALDVGGRLIDRLWPDPAQRDQAKLAMLDLAQKGELAGLTAAAGIVKAEAESDHWLAAVWRPLTMLVFTALIVARWLGWASPQLSEAEYLKLWSIVEFGLGGYVLSRGVEKITPAWADALKNKGK